MIPEHVNAFLAHLSEVREVKPNEWEALCPCHDDHHPSLGITLNDDGALLVHCLTSGCLADGAAVCRATNQPESALYPPRDRPARAGLTVEELAQAKGFTVDELKAFGVTQDGNRVRLTYHDEQGQPVQAARYRHSLDPKVKPRFSWSKGSEPVLYGLHRLDLARAKRSLAMVEGESDSQTLWLHDIPALGFPGADMTGKLKAEHLQGIEKVYAVVENDAGAGVGFARSLMKRLDELAFQGERRAIRPPSGLKDANAWYLADPIGFGGQFRQAAARAASLSDILKPSEEKGVPAHIRSVASLLAKPLKPPTAIVPGLVYPGATIFAGKPKIGKSWFALTLCMALAFGSPRALGAFPVDQSNVLYVSLEDGESRLKSRIERLLGPGAAAPVAFDYTVTLAPLDAGGIEDLTAWLKGRPRPRLIIVDTLVRIKPREDGKSSSRTIYEAQYEAVQPLQELCKKWPELALWVVTHVNKQRSSDPLDLITGGFGGAAAADGALVLSGGEVPGEGIIAGVHRDADELLRMRLKRDQAGGWMVTTVPKWMAAEMARKEAIEPEIAYEDTEWE